MVKRFFVLLIALLPAFSFASHSYLNQHEEGWYWRNEPKESVKKKEKKPSSRSSHDTSIADPDKTWKLIGKRVQQARAQAILNPTPKNIAQARRLQRMMVSQANLFSEKWMLDLLLNPDQDESLMNPSGSAARDVYNNQSNMEKEKAIALIRKKSGLFYFYKAGEPYSERMAQIIHDFALSYQLPLIPIAMTQDSSPQFPNSHVDSGEAALMGVKHIPAVFALNPVSNNPMPIAYGLVSHSELKEHILLAVQTFQVGDYHAH
ncbi:type-F conjugative transfer system pilin assembly protein TraF [Legionella pneumophila]|uniref:type-F conjugative transfer system pilin assembly protein TraF n=1 Tax=Legionella pneumophila TaxID=446 RepID=UPI000770964C|nr:type-F conjugative transfer system pilin assembly protein TraF [Legionella pneumophila]CZP45009.1 conjugal pilus assembly protein TraF [Legionella pneumophila]